MATPSVHSFATAVISASPSARFSRGCGSEATTRLPPSFAFASNFPSVKLLDTSDIDAYGRALREALTQPRTTRPLNGFTLQSTADRYLAIARDVLNLRVKLS